MNRRLRSLLALALAGIYPLVTVYLGATHHHLEQRSSVRCCVPGTAAANVCEHASDHGHHHAHLHGHQHSHHDDHRHSPCSDATRPLDSGPSPCPDCPSDTNHDCHICQFLGQKVVVCHVDHDTATQPLLWELSLIEPLEVTTGSLLTHHSRAPPRIA